MAILIVDDSQHTRKQLELCLKAGGYKDLRFAESAEEASRILGIGGSEDNVEKVDLILMDIIMPEIDGIEACNKIKENELTKHIPIIMVTAKTETESLVESFKAGAMDYIVKPLNEIELHNRVRSALSLKHETDIRKARERVLLNINKELNAAQDEIRRLRGFLPVCGNCKKIRDDKGYIEEVEIYMKERSDIEFSQNICEDCKE